MLVEYATIAAFAAIAVVFILASMIVGKWLRPNRAYGKKLQTYECGEEPVGKAWFNFNPRFYIIALIYIVFDIEIAFIYPVAVVFKQWVAENRGWFAFSEFVVFVGILLLGLAYVWRKGDLQWLRIVNNSHGAHGITARDREALDARENHKQES